VAYCTAWRSKGPAARSYRPKAAILARFKGNNTRRPLFISARFFSRREVGGPSQRLQAVSPIDAKDPGLKRPSKALKKFLLCVVGMAKKPLSVVRDIKKVMAFPSIFVLHKAQRGEARSYHTTPGPRPKARGGTRLLAEALLSCFYSNAAPLCFRSDSSCSRRFAIELSAGLSCDELRPWICSRGMRSL
jgi:hypothetical protein